MLLTFVIFIIILSILVLIHELGHFMAAKLFGIKVEEFGFGLPPRIIGKKIGETIYSLNMLPIGGFVRLLGEEEDIDVEEIKDPKLKKRTFFVKPAWQRVIVLTAGVAMNFILAIVIISYVFTQGIMMPVERVIIDDVFKDSPAQNAGFLKGDVVLAIEDMKITQSDELVKITKENLGRKLNIVILRDLTKEQTKPLDKQYLDNCNKKYPQIFKQLSNLTSFICFETNILARENPPEGQGAMGVLISNFVAVSYPWYQAPFKGTIEAFQLSGLLIKGITKILWDLITFKQVDVEVAGPVGIAQLTGRAVKFGELAVIELLGLLSLNLAIVNILPFPALDGGRLLFVVIELTTGRKVRVRWERKMHQIGMAVLLSLLILITINDIKRAKLIEHLFQLLP